MSYFPIGRVGSINFEKDELVCIRGDDEQRIHWSSIRSVRIEEEGARVEGSKNTILVPKDVVWFDLVVEDIITKARAANPRYEGPVQAVAARDLRVPSESQERANYIRRAQRFYKDRCPNYEEFLAFLTANQDFDFDESTYFACSMAMCSGSPVDEGFSTDLSIPKSFTWYRKFEKAVGGGRRSGRELLEVLTTIGP